MNDRDAARIRLHDDTPLFREAIAFTAAKTGFDGQVIEKDYFCTVLLEDLALNGGKDLFFKGGTCLAKVHAGFYRLSEDLDFAIPLHVDASRAERSRAADAVRRAVAGVSARLSCFSCQTELTGRPSFVDMVRRKLAIPDNPPVDIGAERMTALRRQVEPKLKTVLRQKEFRDFVLDRAITLVLDMATRVA